MPRWVAIRILSTIPTLVGVAILVFLLVRFIPGTVVEQILGAQFDISQGQIDALRAYFGLDQPLYRQFWTWASGILQGDFGTSWRLGVSVRSLIWSRLPVTLELAFLSLIVALAIALPAGIISALRRGTAVDAGVRAVSLLGLSLPEFWLGTLFVLLSSRYFGWSPAARYVPFREDPVQNLASMAFPALTLGLVLAANLSRMTRSALLDVMSRDYIRTARAKGLSEHRVLTRHALRTAVIPIMTVVGLQVGYLLGGVVVIEQVFTIPGMGRLAVNAIQQRDYPLVQGVILVSALLFIFVNLVVDLLYAVLDPRARVR
ncbi:MAG: ABC transporter permease [Thermomicrobiales bacterium]|nr:ABC transporter permease [Thermomicrobiales bacterium]